MRKVTNMNQPNYKGIFIGASIFSVLWAIVGLFIVPDIYMMLGGATILFYMLPIIAFVPLKYRELAGTLWGIISTLVGLVSINYLHSYFTKNYIEIKFLPLVFITFMPACLILLGYLWMVQSFLNFRRAAWNNGKDFEALKCFFGFLILMISIAMGLTIPLLDFFGGMRNVNLGYEVVMGAVIISYSYFLFESRKITNDTLVYYSKPFHRYNVDIGKIRRYLFIGTLLLIAISIPDELYRRRHWTIWTETNILLIINNVLLFKFGRVLFIPATPPDVAGDNLYLPSIKSKKTIIILAVILLIMIICAWTAPLR